MLSELLVSVAHQADSNRFIFSILFLLKQRQGLFILGQRFAGTFFYIDLSSVSEDVRSARRGLRANVVRLKVSA